MKTNLPTWKEIDEKLEELKQESEKTTKALEELLEIVSKPWIIRDKTCNRLTAENADC